MAREKINICINSTIIVTDWTRSQGCNNNQNPWHNRPDINNVFVLMHIAYAKNNLQLDFYEEKNSIIPFRKIQNP